MAGDVVNWFSVNLEGGFNCFSYCAKFGLKKCVKFPDWGKTMRHIPVTVSDEFRRGRNGKRTIARLSSSPCEYRQRGQIRIVLFAQGLGLRVEYLFTAWQEKGQSQNFGLMLNLKRRNLKGAKRPNWRRVRDSNPQALWAAVFKTADLPISLTLRVAGLQK
jgi:hypothetical protein